MTNDFFLKIKNAKWQTWTLVILIIAGVFLRTYRFKDWLLVASDQMRDLTLVSNVVNGSASWPLLGPDMSGGGGFKLGPIYYYFQIIIFLLMAVCSINAILIHNLF